MKKTLIILAHEDLEQSKVNQYLFKYLTSHMHEQNLSHWTLHNLSKNYPDYNIDVKKEQKLLKEHDNVILQFPLQWFSSPAILKKWMDTVFTYGFAFGSEYALQDKKLQVVVTIGGAEASYTTEGQNGFSLEQILAPIEATARYLRMDYQAPLALYQTYGLKDQQLAAFAKKYVNNLNEYHLNSEFNSNLNNSFNNSPTELRIHKSKFHK
jgi:glutathione-regulated potassium-efflux system ancillary protein KefG